MLEDIVFSMRICIVTLKARKVADSLRGELTGVRSCHELPCVDLYSAGAAKIPKWQNYDEVAKF